MENKDKTVNFGDIAHKRLGITTQVASFYFDGLAGYPCLGNGLSVNRVASYHSWEIPEKDAEEFIRRVSEHREKVLNSYDKEHTMAEARQPKVDDYIYCHSCGHIDLCENFPFDGPDDDFRERRCPHCYSDDGINLSNVPGCENCSMFSSVDECRDCPNPRNWTRSLNRHR